MRYERKEMQIFKGFCQLDRLIFALEASRDERVRERESDMNGKERFKKQVFI